MSSTTIIDDVPGFVQLLSDGTVKQLFSMELSPPSPESTEGYKSKDVVIDSAKPITARLYLPIQQQQQQQQLAVLVYFHGGGFCLGTTRWSGYNKFLGATCAECQVIVVSVDYRLAPQHRLPTAFDDCCSSIEWLASARAGDEPWLARADLSRVFIAGDSAGGNIVHNVMLRLAARSVIGGVSIKGLTLIHPFFGSQGRIECEAPDGAQEAVKIGDGFWRLSLPQGSDRDDPACNFEKAADVEWQRFPAVQVFAAGLDFLKDRALMYAGFLKRKGVKVEFVMAEDQIHAYNALLPDIDATKLLQRQMREFMNHHL